MGLITNVIYRLLRFAGTFAACITFYNLINAAYTGGLELTANLNFGATFYEEFPERNCSARWHVVTAFLRAANNIIRAVILPHEA